MLTIRGEVQNWNNPDKEEIEEKEEQFDLEIIHQPKHGECK